MNLFSTVGSYLTMKAVIGTGGTIAALVNPVSYALYKPVLDRALVVGANVMTEASKTGDYVLNIIKTGALGLVAGTAIIAGGYKLGKAIHDNENIWLEDWEKDRTAKKILSNAVFYGSVVVGGYMAGGLGVGVAMAAAGYKAGHAIYHSDPDSRIKQVMSGIVLFGSIGLGLFTAAKLVL